MRGLEILLPSRRGGSGTDISLKNGGVRPRRPCPLNLGLGPSRDLGMNIQMLPAGTTVKKNKQFLRKDDVFTLGGVVRWAIKRDRCPSTRFAGCTVERVGATHICGGRGQGGPRIEPHRAK